MIAPATRYPSERSGVKLLVVDPVRRTMQQSHVTALPALLEPGDLIVVNDAATLPASLHGHDEQGHVLELRLAARLCERRFRAVLFGAGSWRDRTENRAPPPPLATGAVLVLGELRATVLALSALSPRLIDVEFQCTASQMWRGLYRAGRVVQYSYLEHELALWGVQTAYASRPWAFEMPSAGRPLSWELLLALRRRGVAWATLTHAAGLSATGDPRIDAALPLPERYDIPAPTSEAIGQARQRGGRVIAVGTTVVRALEGAALNAGGIVPGPGETALKLDREFRPAITHGVLSGVHERGESHHALLGAFADTALLDRALEHAARQGFRSHELGDAMLILPNALGRRTTRGASSAEPAAGGSSAVDRQP